MRIIIELIHKAQSGDDEAFLELFQKFEGSLYRIAFVHLKNKEDALDAVQETAYRSFKKIDTLRNPQFFKTWLTKIAIACATDLLRKRSKVVHLSPEYAEIFGQHDEDIPLSITIRQLLNSLDENERTIIFLKFYMEYTFKEIKEKLHYRSIFQLDGKRTIEDFSLEDTVLRFNFHSFINNKDLEPFTVKLSNEK